MNPIISILIAITILYVGCSYEKSVKESYTEAIEDMPEIDLKRPDNSIDFFEDLRKKSEAYWKTVELNKGVYGFQIQKNMRWKEGLSESQIDSFELDLQIKFPEGLRNYYRVMNGVNLPAINIYGNSGEEPAYSKIFYSYPEDLPLIKERIEWIYSSNKITSNKLIAEGISRVFPVFGHRFVLVDDEEGVVLSMYGDDIIYWTDNISKLLAIEIFEGLELPEGFEPHNSKKKDVKFWLD